VPEQKIGSACHSFVPYMLLICRSRAIGVCNDGSSSWVGLMSPLNAGFHSDISADLSSVRPSEGPYILGLAFELPSSLAKYAQLSICLVDS